MKAFRDPLLDSINALHDKDKAWLIGQLLDGGVEMSERLSDALIPLTKVYRNEYERLLAAVEE